MKYIILLVVCYFSLSYAAETKPGRFLSLPVPQKCANRPRNFTFGNHNYFYTGHLRGFEDKKFDWLDARNFCREYCMDAVSLETQQENDLIYDLIKRHDIPYIWTSGRICDFEGCEDRKDLIPLSLYGWFWSVTRKKIFQTNRVAPGWTYNPWSRTGHKKVPQPDNAEFDINQTSEACLAVLNNVYRDGINWHDVACYHPKATVCEDNDELLTYVQSLNPRLRIFP